jgi:ppGpp synthetase/RelA/SpoT-type nucleotidyltranferase
MEWAKPEYTRREVNWAGKYLSQPPDIPNSKDYSQAIDIVDNFRAAHSFPLNTLQNRLRLLANCADDTCIVAQRLKRLSSAIAKLEILNKMELWDMQDIGGCRAVVKNISVVDNVVDAFKSSEIKHKLTHEDDYIRNPKISGYRSRHLVYRYFSDKKKTYNGMKIEVQIRSPLQHAWATTVETVDIFTQQALKSSRGSKDWERFFQLMGTQMAFREQSPPVPNTPTNQDELKRQLRLCAQELDVDRTLRGFATALRITRQASVKDKGNIFFLLSLNNSKERLKIVGYDRKGLEEASADYSKKEQQIRNGKITDAVLVSVDLVRNLERAYPNYFADNGVFLAELRTAIE